MLPTSYYFPEGKATRANYRKAWRYILRNHRNMYVTIRNDAERTLFLRYLGFAGVNMPAKEDDDDYVTYKMRFPGDYVTAIRYRNEMIDDLGTTANHRITMYSESDT